MGSDWGGNLQLRHSRPSKFYQMSRKHRILDLNFSSYTTAAWIFQKVSLCLHFHRQCIECIFPWILSIGTCFLNVFQFNEQKRITRVCFHLHDDIKHLFDDCGSLMSLML